MIVFNELRIDKNKHLIVDASVLDIEQQEDTGDIVITDIIIGFGSNTDVVNYWDAGNNIPSEGHASAFTRYDRNPTTNGLKGFRLNFSIEENANQLIYVKVAIDNEDPSNLPNCSIPTSIEGYVYDKCLLMNSVFTYLKESNKDCGDITNLANYIAKIKGLELAIEGGNFELAKKYWNKFFMNNSTGVSSSNCCCR